MNYLKTKLSFKILFITILIIIYAVIVSNLNPTSSYKGTETEIIGTVKTYKYDSDNVTITLKAKEKILGYYYLDENENLNLKYGIKVKLNGSLKLPNENTNQNLFNYRNYLLSQNIKWTFNIEKIEIISNEGNVFYQIKNKINDQINKAPLTKEYLKTFILGENIIEKDIKESYQNNGISHLLSISGMHITLLSGLILFVLSKIINKPKISYLITVIIVFCYAFLTGFKPPVIRASCFFFLFTLNMFLDLKIKALNYLMVLSIVLLIFNPYLIYDLGFKFSFVVSFYIILFSRLITNQNTYLKKTFVISLIAFIAGFPILINNFYSLNLLTPIINLIFVPFVSIIIFPFSLITFICPSLDLIFFKLITIMEQMSMIVDKIDYFNLTFSKVPIMIIIVYYVLITIAFLKNKLKYWLLLILVLLSHYLIPYFNFNYEYHVLDVGQGDASLIRFPNNEKNILIDTGGQINKETFIAKNTLIPYFKSLGIKSIDYLILTHGDYDHMGESLDLVNNFKVDKVIFNNDKYGDLELELIKVLDEKHIKYYQNVEELKLNNNKLYFLNDKLYDNENDNSIVLYTELNGVKLLLMGDASVEVETELIEKYDLKEIDILKVGHHGSKTSTSVEFIDVVNPNYSVISVGKNNMYGHPNQNVLENLKDSDIYRTDMNGSIKFKIKNNKLEIETCTP